MAVDPRGADVDVQHRATSWGVVRSRVVGRPRDGVPEVVVVHGLAVADYLQPALCELGTWTRAHLVELPGFSGSGEPPHPMDVGQFADAVVQWLDASGLDRVVLVGHSSGTQVAAHVAVRRPHVTRALVLASPTMDPRFRSTRRILLAWRRNHALEPPSLDERHTPERQRAGLRRVRHALRVHLADALEDVVPSVPVPVLVLYGDQDRICTEAWARELGELAPDGRFRLVPGAHSFVWTAPSAWSAPIEELAREVA
ncbi:alpha/beta hydrolase [Geodermatophilus sp. TF02-6]|uniref:alpha/beta fold hydrolase n=1 Tax=Geodermatophilus sp. TF02-6 TaxID=2250575 RepID=UPI000DE85910|nr:alpha/beta hydrolase [Geodermatophilus sp. TF02-6]RBY80531.1 alpha/beta hydrolase [Geodermatophilus sp. TF02-6]